MVRAIAPLVVITLLVALTLIFLAEPVRVSSSSMSPTFHSGNQVLVQKFGGRAHHPHRRDVIAFHVPGTSGLVVKRVVAVGGDSVGIADGVLTVNGTPVPESFVDYNLMDATYFGPIEVATGTVFVMGDNRSDSVDSRTFGAISVDDIVGRVVLRVWPP
ncbi:MAG: signal peptidase I [Actinomycetota bacterium]|nr:signal peptidase I [Actinomycetota bacterium]